MKFLRWLNVRFLCCWASSAGGTTTHEVLECRSQRRRRRRLARECPRYSKQDGRHSKLTLVSKSLLPIHYSSFSNIFQLFLEIHPSELCL